jgi:DNA polymerase
MPQNLFGQRMSAGGKILGCDGCPSNKVPGLRKIKGLSRIKGCPAFLWAQSPGKIENAKGLELVGPDGELLWGALKKTDLSRKDFDIQNIVRCRPVDEGRNDRDPSKKEILCCSVYNDQARELNRSCARVHLVLGDIAGSQLLGKAFKKSKPIFWHEPWDAYVVLNWHPNYLLRQGGENTGEEYLTWQNRFRAVREIINHPGRWGYVKSRDYRTVRTLKEFDEMERLIRLEAKTGRRVSVDVEDGDNRKTLLLAGFGVGHWRDPKDWQTWTGTCWSVVLDHPEARYELSHAREMKQRVRKLVEDDSIKKSLHNGSYDSNQFRGLLQARLRGYDYDTMYGTYLRYSYLRSCSLENLTYRFFPEFCDYKDVTAGWEENFAKVPLDRLVLRNCGDCDVTKKLEERFAPQVPYPLMQVYIHAGFTLDSMENRGPLLDQEQWDKANKIVPKMIVKLDRKLQQISGEPTFDCDSPKQVAWLIYDVLKLPIPEEGRSTKNDVLNQLAAVTGNPTLEIIQKRRSLRVIQSTFLGGYARSAHLHGGELRTIWWLTGAVTGRLRSGKGDRAEAEGVVNFQNLHGNPLLQNLLVSDVNWRRALEK